MPDDAGGYRSNAADCLRRVQSANSQAQRDRLAAMALTWMLLADQSDAVVRGYSADARGWDRLTETRRRSDP